MRYGHVRLDGDDRVGQPAVLGAEHRCSLRVKNHVPNLYMNIVLPLAAQMPGQKCERVVQHLCICCCNATAGGKTILCTGSRSQPVHN